MAKEETYVELAKINAQSHSVREGTEWKVLLTLWLGLGLVIWAFIDKQIVLPCYGKCLFLTVYLVLVLVIIRCTILPLHKAHRLDRLWQHYYMRQAEGKKPGETEPEEPPWYFGLTTPWPWAQIAVLVALTIMTFLVVLRVPSIDP